MNKLIEKINEYKKMNPEKPQPCGFSMAYKLACANKCADCKERQ